VADCGTTTSSTTTQLVCRETLEARSDFHKHSAVNISILCCHCQMALSVGHVIEKSRVRLPATVPMSSHDSCIIAIVTLSPTNNLAVPSVVLALMVGCTVKLSSSSVA